MPVVSDKGTSQHDLIMHAFSLLSTLCLRLFRALCHAPHSTTHKAITHPSLVFTDCQHAPPIPPFPYFLISIIFLSKPCKTNSQNTPRSQFDLMCRKEKNRYVDINNKREFNQDTDNSTHPPTKHSPSPGYFLHNRKMKKRSRNPPRKYTVLVR